MIKKILTLEHLLYALIIIIGIAFRFISLGRLPLSDAEGVVSLHALGLLSRGTTVAYSDQTFLANLQAIFFFFFGNSNFSARFFPALLGTLFILTPALFRSYFPSKAMIILSFWIAISPTFIALSRQVNSTLLFLLAIVLFIYFFIKRKTLPSAIFFIISLLSGKIFFWTLITLLFTLIYVHLVVNKQNSPIYEKSIWFFKSFEWKKFWFAAMIGYVFLSTMGFIFPDQFSGVGYGVNAYLNSWSHFSSLRLSDLVRGMLFYEIGVILFGIAGIIYIVRKNQLAGLFITGILSFGFVQFVLISEKSIIYLLIILLPLIIAASFFINHFANFPKSFGPKILVVTSIALSILFFISLAFMSMFANPYQGEQENTLRIFFIIAGFALIIGAGLLAGWAISWQIAGKSFLFVALIFLSIINLSAAVNGSGLRNPYQNEILSISPIPIEQDLLIDTLEDYSEWNYGNHHTINVYVMGDQPASLFWALREFDNITQGNEIPLNENIDIIITNADQTLVQSDMFRGQDILWTSYVAWDSMSSSEFAQWFLARRAPQDILNQKSIIVWVRNSLFPGSDTQ